MARSLRVPLNVGSAIAGAFRTLSLRSLTAINCTAISTATTIAIAILKTAIAIQLNVSMCTLRSLTIEWIFPLALSAFYNVQGGGWALCLSIGGSALSQVSMPNEWAFPIVLSYGNFEPQYLRNPWSHSDPILHEGSYSQKVSADRYRPLSAPKENFEVP